MRIRFITVDGCKREEDRAFPAPGGPVPLIQVPIMRPMAGEWWKKDKTCAKDEISFFHRTYEYFGRVTDVVSPGRLEEVVIYVERL